MGTNEKQLENLLRGSDSNKIEEFLQSNLNTPQACGTVFESCLRRVAQQGIQKNRAETVLCVLKIVKYLCEQNNQRGIHVLIAAGILETLGKIFLYVTEKAAGRQLNVSDLLTLLLDCITSVIELQSNKYTWLQSNCDLFLSFLCKSYTNVELKRKVVEAFIGILVSLDSTSMDQIRSSISCTPLIDDLVENILLNLNYFGDYDVQVGIVELLFRLYPTVKRKEKAQSWNHNDETARLFCCISYNNFESSARAYINKVNQTSQEKWVASYHCMSLVIGDLVLGEKDECWMDLCFRSRNLGIAFGPRFEYGWYAVMSDNVEDFKIEDEESNIKMVLTTKVSVRRMFENDSFSDTLRVISFTFRKTAYFTAAFLRSKVNQIFSKIAKVSKGRSFIKSSVAETDTTVAIRSSQLTVETSQPSRVGKFSKTVPYLITRTTALDVSTHGALKHKTPISSENQHSQIVVPASQPSMVRSSSLTKPYPIMSSTLRQDKSFLAIESGNQFIDVSNQKLTLQEKKIRQQPPIEVVGSQVLGSQLEKELSSSDSVCIVNRKKSFGSKSSLVEVIPETQNESYHDKHNQSTSHVELGLAFMHDQNQLNISAADKRIVKRTSEEEKAIVENVGAVEIVAEYEKEKNATRQSSAEKSRKPRMTPDAHSSSEREVAKNKPAEGKRKRKKKVAKVIDSHPKIHTRSHTAGKETPLSKKNTTSDIVNSMGKELEELQKLSKKIPSPVKQDKTPNNQIYKRNVSFESKSVNKRDTPVNSSRKLQEKRRSFPTRNISWFSSSSTSDMSWIDGHRHKPKDTKDPVWLSENPPPKLKTYEKKTSSTKFQFGKHDRSFMEIVEEHEQAENNKRKKMEKLCDTSFTIPDVETPVFMKQQNNLTPVAPIESPRVVLHEKKKISPGNSTMEIKHPKKLHFSRHQQTQKKAARTLPKKHEVESKDTSDDEILHYIEAEVSKVFNKRQKQRRRSVKRFGSIFRTSAYKMRELQTKFSEKRIKGIHINKRKFEEMGNNQQILMGEIKSFEEDMVAMQMKCRGIVNKASMSLENFKNLRQNAIELQEKGEMQAHYQLCKLSAEVGENLAEFLDNHPW